MPTIPIRSMVRAGKGNTLISVDLSQAESWIVAYLSGEEKMKHSLKYGDIHTDTAANAVFQCKLSDVTKIMRYTGKRTNHATAYGMSPPRFVQVVNKESDKPPFVIISLEQARLYQTRWYGYYYKVKEWQNSIRSQLRLNRTLNTPYNRMRMFYGNLQSYEGETDKAAYSYIPQSTVADHFNGAIHPNLLVDGGLLGVFNKIINRYSVCSIVNQSHDSCIIECESSVAGEIGEQVGEMLHRPLVINEEEFWIPVDLEIGEVWGSLDKIKTFSKYKNA